MATTQHYQFIQPVSSDNYDLSIWNTNLTMIDTQIYQTQTIPFKIEKTTDPQPGGKPGVCPPPLIGDDDKVIHGDGTWDTALSRIDFTQLSAQQIADLKTALGIS